MIENDAMFLDSDFSIEADFSFHWQANKQNCLIWGTEMPSDHEEPLRSEKVILWLSMWSIGLIRWSSHKNFA